MDDEEMVRTAAGLLVERLGFRVLSASGGAEAVELFRKSQREVSCVLLDVTMPAMDGEETFWALREIREDVPVLFMSGHSSREIDSRLLRKSRVGKLRKPFRRVELERRLRELLEKGSAESTPAA
jgi:CheY-like chemotaxis protein